MPKPDPSSRRVIVVGAGLSGLACARQLAAAGCEVEVLEASDGVGGRVRTDEVDGYLLDRGFQVLLAAYPVCGRNLDPAGLDLRPFFPGALVRTGGRFHRVADPFRRPLAALGGVFSPIGSLADKLRVARLRHRLMTSSLAEIFSRPETTTREALRDEGFSETMIERFFRPFLGGIFLDAELVTSSRMFEFVFKMFSSGDTAVPARGMGAIPEQLAAALPAGSVRTAARVVELADGGVRLAGGETVRGDAVVVAAAPEGELGRALGLPEVAWCSTVCFYFAAERPPIEAPILALDGDGRGPVNNLCVPSQAAPSYAPPGRSLVSATVIGEGSGDGDLETAVRNQLAGWFGAEVDGWRHLRTYEVRHALPAQPPGALEPPARPVRLGERLFACGDHLDTASIEGAITSGKRAAAAVLAEL